MSTTYRAPGAFNGLLPVPTGMVIGFMRDPSKMPYLKYAQLVPAPEIDFSYFTLAPDDVQRLVDLTANVWAYDDYRPSGKQFDVRGQWTEGRITRYDFAWMLGENTMRVWNKNGVDWKQIYNAVQANRAQLHRASRVVSALASNLTGTSTATLNAVMGFSPGTAYFDKSSGIQYDPATGADNPNYQIIKKSFMKVKRRIHLATNANVTGEELIAVIPPIVAEAIAASGEMADFLKQSRYADKLTNPNMADWNLPESYGGFKLVVEDTPRVLINKIDAGTQSDVTVAAQRDYILNTDTVYFVSRPGGLDGGYGFRNYSTVQVYHFGGEAQVEAFSEPKHQLVEGHVVLQDKITVPAAISGFALTDVLSV